MMAWLLQAVVLAAAVAIVARAEPALNRMTRATPLAVRAAFLLLTLGASAEVVWILAGGVPSWPTAITAIGTAVLLVGERRAVLGPLQWRSEP